MILSASIIFDALKYKNVICNVGLHCSCSRWSTESELFGDKRLAKYLSNIEEQYQVALDKVNTDGGTEALHKSLARLKSLASLAQQQKDLQQVCTCISTSIKNKRV